MPTVKEIITQYLKDNGYDGLYNGEGPCGCLAEDLFPCGEMFDECSPGYKGACNCGECDWHIYGSKDIARAADEEHAVINREDA